MILAVYLRGKQSVGIRAIHVLSFIIQCGDDKRITEMGVGALQIFAFTDIINFFFSKLQAYFKIYIADYYALTN